MVSFVDNAKCHDTRVLMTVVLVVASAAARKVNLSLCFSALFLLLPSHHHDHHYCFFVYTYLGTLDFDMGVNGPSLWSRAFHPQNHLITVTRKTF